MRISPRKLLFVALTFGFYFVGGISFVNAYYLSPLTFNSIDDQITGVFGGDTYGLHEFYVSFEPDGSVANGGGGSDAGVSFVRNCQIIGDCFPDSTSVGANDGWIFTVPNSFHILVASSISSVDIALWYNYCSSNTYNSCLSYVAPLSVSVDDKFIVFDNTTSISSTTTQYDYTSHFNFLILICLSLWFLLVLYCVKAQTLKFL